MRFYSHSHKWANRKRKSAFGGFVKPRHEVKELNKKILEQEAKDAKAAEEAIESFPDHLWNA